MTASPAPAACYDDAAVIPLLDLHAQYRQIGPDVEAAVLRVLRSGRYALGPEVDAFEQEFAAYCGADLAVGTSSGTSALYLALVACDIGPGDEVVTVPFTFLATVATILQTGATARLVDIDPVTMTLDPDQLESAITVRTKAIVPVHLYGQAADMTPIVDVARRHDIVVIEDAAQAHGARDRGRRVGSIGDLACFSFYPSKNLGACGEGGMVVTSDPTHAAAIRQLRSWGHTPHGDRVRTGGNFRLEAVQAAVLRVKLGYLDAWNAARRDIAAHYDRLLAPLPVTPPRPRRDSEHVYHVYATRTSARDHVVGVLRDRGIGTAVHYPRPIHLEPGYASLGYRAGRFPHAERAAREVFSLPIYPELAAGDVVRVVAEVRNALDVSRHGHETSTVT